MRPLLHPRHCVPAIRARKEERRRPASRVRVTSSLDRSPSRDWREWPLAAHSGVSARTVSTSSRRPPASAPTAWSRSSFQPPTAIAPRSPTRGAASAVSRTACRQCASKHVHRTSLHSAIAARLDPGRASMGAFSFAAPSASRLRSGWRVDKRRRESSSPSARAAAFAEALARYGPSFTRLVERLSPPRFSRALALRRVLRRRRALLEAARPGWQAQARWLREHGQELHVCGGPRARRPSNAADVT
jgi:hypothetical protein